MNGKLVNCFITPFNSSNSIDYEEIKKLIIEAKMNKNDGLLLFSLTGEGTNLSLNEKMEIMNFIKKNSDFLLYYSIDHLSLNESLEEINKLKDMPIDYFVVTCPYYVKPNQDGLFLYFKNIAKELYPRQILLHNIPARTGVNLSFNTIKKLYKSQHNIVGLIESSTDLNLISLLKKDFPLFQVYLLEDKLIYEALNRGVDGIFSPISISFGKIIKEIIDDYQIGYRNELIISYIKLVSEIFSEYDNPTNIKYFLSKKGYKSMYLRLPLVGIKENNEDFNLLI